MSGMCVYRMAISASPYLIDARDIRDGLFACVLFWVEILDIRDGARRAPPGAPLGGPEGPQGGGEARFVAERGTLGF